MSRRRGEFEHCTSIFEGAFRAWSHLGGLEPCDLETKPATELDPLTNPLENDFRFNQDNKKKKGEDNDSDPDQDGDDSPSEAIASGKRREYPYEPLPRSGLAHPFVQAILSPWLGPDADQDAIQLGLTTLRTWWQHRRKGESGSAVAALGTDKMRGVVEGYTRHFFNLAHCLVTNDGEQPPRTLHGKMRELEKVRNKRSKKKAREEEASKLAALAVNAGLAHGLSPTALMAPTPLENDEDESLTPLERLHAAQRRQLAERGGVAAVANSIDVRGKCIPGKIDIPAVVDQVSAQASQLAHRGVLAAAKPDVLPSSMIGNGSASELVAIAKDAPVGPYGDVNKIPLVFVSESGDMQIAMSVDGITCAHCVKIVETVLRGCNGNKSPIDGLLDAAADRSLNVVLIKIDKSCSAKRIAFESARNLAMVGYTAKAKEIDISDMKPGSSPPEAKVDIGVLYTAFEVVAATEPTEVFNWNIPCSCPDNGVLREDCARHSQMNKKILEEFDRREIQLTHYMTLSGNKLDLECNCDTGGDNGCCPKHGDIRGQKPSQRSLHTPTGYQELQHIMQQSMSPQSHQNALHNALSPQQILAMQQQHQDMGQGMVGQQHIGNIMCNNTAGFSAMSNGPFAVVARNSMTAWNAGRVARNMSITSETTFGRAMSGLSALSIDWENMDDFDVNVDHSENIADVLPPCSPQVHPLAGRDAEEGIMAGCDMSIGGECSCGPSCACVGCPMHDKLSPGHSLSLNNGKKRSSLRKNMVVDTDTAQNMQVSFKV